MERTPQSLVLDVSTAVAVVVITVLVLDQRKKEMPITEGRKDLPLQDLRSGEQSP